MENQEAIVKNKFNDRWTKHFKGYDDLVAKMKDRYHVVYNDVTLSQVHRAVLTNDYLLRKYKKGSAVIDAACGNGFNACYLKKEGYDVVAFDTSHTAIEQASNLADRLELPNSIFKVQDHTFFETVSEESIDIVYSLGLMRYLDDKEIRGYIYKQVNRILKPEGCFIVSNDNVLFEMFALNDGTLNFWAETIEGFSNVKDALANKSVKQAMEEVIHLPKRSYTTNSVSKHIKRHSENPFTYDKWVEEYGFKIDKIAYPDCNLLPPLVEKNIDEKLLEEIKSKICLPRAENDWRSMFMGAEFLAFLVK